MRFEDVVATRTPPPRSPLIALRQTRTSSPRHAVAESIRPNVAGEEAIAELDARGADCLPPLKAHVGMTRAAEDHVEDLVRTKRLGHTGPMAARRRSA